LHERWRTPARLALTLALAASPQAQSAGARAPASLAEASARVQSLIQGPANHLAPFRPWIAGIDNPWHAERAVPLVRVGAPWGPDDALWIQVPEHTWTIAPGASDFTLIFSGRPRAIADAHHWAVRYPPLAAPAWRDDGQGGIALDCALAGGITVHFQVRAGERMFETRYGITNDTEAPLGESWAQLCNGFEAMGALSEQAAESVRLVAGGKPIGWGAAGQDTSWMDRFRDPDSCLVVRGCFFKALLTAPELPVKTAPELMELARPIDLPLVAKSSADGRRHLVLYSPCAREVMYNALSPCCHADPFVDGVPAGATRWLVQYGLFYEGELATLCSALIELDRTLRTRSGFVEP
jgi:hypothetical protein